MADNRIPMTPEVAHTIVLTWKRSPELRAEFGGSTERFLDFVRGYFGALHQIPLPGPLVAALIRREGQEQPR